MSNLSQAFQKALARILKRESSINNNKTIKQDNNMEFVHSSGHFAIAKDELTMN